MTSTIPRLSPDDQREVLRDYNTAPSARPPRTPVDEWASRFAVLLAGGAEEPIRCQLRDSTVGEMQGRYEGLSYAWGDPHDQVEIYVDDRLVLVTRNLATALRHLRLRGESRVLWVDALCINQLDVSEVNLQVQRMWAIFQSAHRVVVFLGPQAEGSDEALGLMSHLSTFSVGAEHDRITEMLDDAQMEGAWQSLLQLMQRPWWGRAWVIQEYAVARQVVFICGSGEISNDEFGKALEVLVDYRFNALTSPDHHRLVRHIASTPRHHLWVTRQSYQDSDPNNRPNAAAVIYRFRGSQSLDPRDKIYSLYKLVAENPTLAPDYSRTVAELYMDVVKVMIETSGTLQVLSHHNRQVQGIQGLPTWCPDWTVMRGKRILLWPNRYRAAGSRDQPAFYRISNGTLTIRGRFVDRVKWLKAFESNDFDDQAGIYQSILGIESQARQAANPNQEDDMFQDAFQRTLVGARVRMKGSNRKATILNRDGARPLWRAWADRVQGKPHDAQLAKRYSDAIYSAMSGRAFVITESGGMGLADGTVRVDDVVGVFLGGQVPLALRAQGLATGTSTPGQYELVGECYLHGYMSGEAFEQGENDLSDVDLV